MFTIAGGKKKKKVPERKVPSVFGGDEEGSNENNEVEGKDKGGPMDWRMEMQRYKRKRVDEEQLQKAMEQDPSFAEYDEVYDSMKSAQKSQGKKKEEHVDSKYVETMIRRTHSRKIEQDKITARVKRKEIEQEKDLYGETEEFITPTYKKRLEEMEQWTKEQEEIDKQDTEKEYNAGSFLRKMLDDRTEGKSAAIQGSLKAATPSQPSSESSTSSSSSHSSLSEKPVEEPPKKKPALVAGLNSRKNEDEERQREFLEKERERRVRMEQEKKVKRDQEKEEKRRKKYERRNSAASIEEARKRYFERKGLPVSVVAVK